MGRKSNKQKRIDIAKDVIAQLAFGKYMPLQNSYAVLSDVDALDLTAELQKELVKVQTCSVCALGALFISDVAKHDRCTVEEAGIVDERLAYGLTRTTCVEQQPVRKRLRELFSDRQLAMIEMAFEGWEVREITKVESVVDPDFDAYNKCLAFYHKYKTSTTRMRGIMRNIIKNDGEFIP